MSTKHYISGLVIILYLGLLGYLYSGIGRKAAYPSKPVTIVVHSKPGSAIDFMARKTAAIAKKYSKVPFVVENRPGTQGVVAMQHVIDSKADGYTMLGVTKSFLSTLIVNKSKVSLNDFRFIANMISDPEAIIANRERSLLTLKDVIKDANSDQMQVWIGPGTGSRDHLMALSTWKTLGIDHVKWIDYKSGPQSVLAIMRNEAAIYVGNPADIKGKTGLNIVAIASKQRLPALRDVATFKEQGYNLDESMWRGFAFKKGVPDDAVKYLTSVLKKVVNDRDWKSYCDETYVFSNFEDEAQFTRRIHREVKNTKRYLNKAGLMVDYVKESRLPLGIIFLLVTAVIFLLLLAINRFRFRIIDYSQWVAGGIISVALFFFYQTTLFQIPAEINITSPALIPELWIVVLVVLCSMLIFTERNKPKTEEVSDIKTVWIVVALLFAYLVLMQWAGYYFTTPLFILATMYVLKYRKTASMLMGSFGFVLFSYLVFNLLLHIDLPQGWWFI